MRTIDRTSRFKKDYRRERRGRHAAALEAELVEVLRLPTEDVPLPVKYRDHALTGEWKDHRDCHIRPDLVLIYSKPGNRRLLLVRLGSHSELGL
jgi:mRNA interferase YafQ